MKNRSTETTLVKYARVAGFTYLLIIIIGVLSTVFIDSRMVVSGNDALTASNIVANEFLFRAGIALILIMYASVVVLSWALYILLKPVNTNLALLALLMRLAEAVLGGATVLISFFVLQILNTNSYTTALDPEQLQALAGIFLNVRTAGLDIVLLFVGAGGTVFLYLFLKSKYIPGLLAAWGLFTYISMIILSLVSILFPGHPEIVEIVPYSLGAAFELVIGIWLLFKGVNLQQGGNNTSDAS